MLTDILDHPENYNLVLGTDSNSDHSGNSESDDDNADGNDSDLDSPKRIWADEQHLTTYVHKILGASITQALEALSQKS